MVDLSGIPVIKQNDLPGERVNERNARPHHRRRIAKKWRKRFGMRWERAPVIMQMGTGISMKIICNDLGLKQIQEAVEPAISTKAQTKHAWNAAYARRSR